MCSYKPVPLPKNLFSTFLIYLNYPTRQALSRRQSSDKHKNAIKNTELLAWMNEFVNNLGNG